VQRIADNSDEIPEPVPFALESEAIQVRITVPEYVRETLVAHLSELKPQNEGVIRGAVHPGFERARQG
jgi:hypothetical protein